MCGSAVTQFCQTVSATSSYIRYQILPLVIASRHHYRFVVYTSTKNIVIVDMFLEFSNITYRSLKPL